MHQSLKSSLPALARVLGETPVVLYERQLALMRDAQLASRPGRGPGSGVAATPQTIALLLIAFFGSLSGSNVSERARLIASGRQPGSAKCPLTGSKTFGDALAQVLSDEALARRVTAISINPASGVQVISFDKDERSAFVSKMAPSGLKVEVGIAGSTVRDLAKHAAALPGDDSK